MSDVYQDPLDALASKVAKMVGRPIIASADELQEEYGLDMYDAALPMAVGYFFAKVLENLGSENPELAGEYDDIVSQLDRVVVAMKDSL